MIAAVGGDKYGGLTGYKRPLQSNPTRLPGNLPAFRGVKNTPGDRIRSGPIKSSSAHPDRKTNICIPYARVTPLQGAENMGRCSPGDIVFCSRNRPDIPGYAHARMTRLVGVDFLNRFLAIGTDDRVNTLDRGLIPSKILVGSTNPVNDWRSVPFLQEYVMDGIVLSNDEPAAFGAAMNSPHDAQLFNLAIQGPAAVNNGFLDMQGTGQLSRSMGKNYMETPHDMQDWAQKFQGARYHEYPLQMFDRSVNCLDELFCGLVATRVVYQTSGERKAVVEKLRAEYVALREGDLQEAQQGGLLPQLEVYYENELRKIQAAIDNEYERPFKKAGLFPDGADAPTETSFYKFKYVLFTSAQLDHFVARKTPTKPEDRFQPVVDRYPEEAYPTSVGLHAQKVEDFKNLVGAWKIGKVIDKKAAKMPYFEGGPKDTGYRVTCNVNIEWVDVRMLAEKYAPGSATYPGMTHLTLRRKPVVFHWPSQFSGAAYAAGATTQTPTVASSVKRDEFLTLADFRAKRQRLGYRVAPQAEAVAPPEEEEDEPLELAPILAPIDPISLRQHLFKPKPTFNGDRAAFAAAVAEMMHHNIKLLKDPLTAEEAASVGAPPPLQRHVQAPAPAPAPALAPTGTSNPTRSALFSPPEVSANKGKAPAPPSPAPAEEAAEEAADTAAAMESPGNANIRRRGGNTPSPSPDRGQAPVDASAAGPSGAAEAAAPRSGPRRQRAAQGDVFSDIFGKADASVPQPLNPAHQSKGPAGSSGRSLPRRGRPSQ